MMGVEELREKVGQIQWWHRIDLGHGIVTPGTTNSPKTLSHLGLPEDLRGRTVLDVGAWDGFYSFEAERRGASRVLATDTFSWDGGGWGSKNGFLLAREAFQSKVEDKHIGVLDLSAEAVGTFDLVLFLGVLYHMRHPLLALERIASVTKEQLILETHIEELPTQKPAMVFYPGGELDEDPSNWWGPNCAAVEAMLRVVGFSKVMVHHIAPSAPEAGALQRVFGRPAPEANRSRIVFHAWR